MIIVRDLFINIINVTEPTSGQKKLTTFLTYIIILCNTCKYRLQKLCSNDLLSEEVQFVPTCPAFVGLVTFLPFYLENIELQEL